MSWAFFDQDSSFELEFSSLLKALEEDQPYIKAHTRYQTRALEWQRSGDNPSFLLTGDDLIFAEKWMTSNIDKQPQITSDHRSYIQASRAATNARAAEELARERRVKQLRRTAIGLAVIGILALVATSIAVPTSINVFNTNATSLAQVITSTYGQGQAQNAVATSTAILSALQNHIATSQAVGTQVALDVMKNHTLLMANLSEQELNNNHPEEALQLALESMRYYGTLSPYPGESSVALQNVLSNPVEELAYLHHDTSDQGVEGAVWSKDESRILSWAGDATVRVWDSKSEKKSYNSPPWSFSRWSGLE